ncbi:5-formyltetrahydrofolate cyclo-ligase [Planococcus glaciei]|uniref:5-formyltetrahydrofolate cyclo-ligase n=1 Tax=Planococcus glaciei TaxID=459472 RepID=A0A7H8QD90_9BACL|nr:5-formyltetrahydrofolate cyclo-ligase [Planococcus glaciei]QDY46314.1 5-formyltetrahydrofolate cyclo-ligase [Planococcus glaciei]QKX51839.1 5-formyltetrahydrofolate cyclo-ligase [Planococcus glaciei]
MDKAIQRKQVLDHLNNMEKSEHQRKSRLIVGRLMEDPVFQKAGTVGVTVSAFPEVDTHELIQACWKAGKRVAVPKCWRKDRTMDFYALTDFNQLETVYMHLKEPKVEETVRLEAEDIDLLVVPGVVYTREGYRIGFGGGYYDRYLATYTGATQSLAFDVQLADRIFVEPHDIPVDAIHTESESIATGKVSG